MRKKDTFRSSSSSSSSNKHSQNAFRVLATAAIWLSVLLVSRDWAPSAVALSPPSSSSSITPSSSSNNNNNNNNQTTRMTRLMNRRRSADTRDSAWVSTTIQNSRRGRTMLLQSENNGNGNGNETEEPAGGATTSFACTHTQRRTTLFRSGTGTNSWWLWLWLRFRHWNRIHVGLFLFYWLGIGNLLLPAALPLTATATATANTNALSVSLQPILTLRSLLVSTLWLGFVLAISGMEAWIKFRAPVCPRAFALDIGRTVFPALNAVEVALCAVCWQQQIQLQQQWWSRAGSFAGATATAGATASSSLGLALVAATAILAADVLLLTPKLVRIGERIVAVARQVRILQNNDNGTGTATAVSDEWEAELTRGDDGEDEHGEPPLPRDHNGSVSWHAVYVVLEIAKVLALGGHIGSSLAALPLSLALPAVAP